MRQPSRRLAATTNFLGSGVSILINVAQAFLLMPLCLTLLGRTTYGAWLATAELLTWLQLLDLGITNLMTQRIGAAIGQGHRDSAGMWFATGLFCLVILGSGLVIAGVGGAPLVTRWAQVPQSDALVFTACFRVTVVASVVILLANGFLGLARGVQHAGIVNAAAVASAAGGFATALGMLLAGYGLWSLAFGFVVRAAISLAGGLIFLVALQRDRIIILALPAPRMLREILQLAPPMAAASLGFLAANLSELILVNTFFGPLVALVYAVTRRIADGVRMLLDSIAWAVYGSFAHLVTSDEHHRARRVLHEILSLRFACACLGVAVYVAVNERIVGLLFGVETFGGLALTIAFGVQVIVGGQGFLVNYLYRAAGYVRHGSWLLAAEAAVRVAAMVAGLCLGVGALILVPLAAAASAWAAMVYTSARLSHALPPVADTAGKPDRLRTASFAVLLMGLVIALVPMPSSWLVVAASAAAVTIAGGGLMYVLQPAEVRRRLVSGWIRS